MHKPDVPDFRRGEWLPDRLAWRYLATAVGIGVVCGIGASVTDNVPTGVVTGLVAFLCTIGVLVVASYVAYRRRAALHRRAWLRYLEVRAEQRHDGPGNRPQ